MNIANMHAEGSAVTMRLKALLENISRLVDYLPGTEQKALLELLEDWKHPERRKNPRKLCSLPCLLYTSPSPRDRQKSRMPSSA